MQKAVYFSVLCLLILQGCRFYEPSTMNAQKPELLYDASYEQIPVEMIDDLLVRILADQYKRYGQGTLNLTMTYDPKSRDYSALSALRDLKEVKSDLKRYSIEDVDTSTLPTEGETPLLVVSYNRVMVAPPSGCEALPGLKDSSATTKFDDYEFGCSIETIFANQIYRPADLEGRGGEVMGLSEGRRAANIVETYHTLNQREQTGELDRSITLDREGLSSE